MEPRFQAGAQGSQPLFSKRHYVWAGLAALLGCAACCAAPILVALGLGSGAVAAFTRVFKPGAELWIGGGFFLLTLTGVAVYRRLRQRTSCGASCEVKGACCDRGAAPRGA